MALPKKKSPAATAIAGGAAKSDRAAEQILYNDTEKALARQAAKMRRRFGFPPATATVVAALAFGETAT